MKLTQRDISHAWGQVKSHVGRAWNNGKAILHTVDRYANIANRVLNASQPMLSKEILDRSRSVLSTYAEARGQVEDMKNRGEKIYGSLSRNVPELF